MLGFVAGMALVVATGPATADTIPSNFFTIVDQQGPNDVNSDQVDLTQMGRDDSDPAMYKIFWSWDSTSLWTGQGQTGDACALFDTDGDGNVNFAVCARITNPNADPTVATLTSDSPMLFSCTDARNDRCSQPDQLLATGITAGTLASGGVDSSGNLITATDPFPTGSDFPNDVTLQVNIPKLSIGNGVLVNVCSYPSAGNGGNNNPFDCIANPGSGFLVIAKDAGSDTSTNFRFTVSPVPQGTSSTYDIAGSGETDEIGLAVGDSTEVAETVPAGWRLDTASCTLEGGGSTGTFDSANAKVTGISIQSGLITRCTFANIQDRPELTLDKSASPSTYDSVGDVISYSYLVTNTGNVRLAGPVTVSDDKATATCPNVNTVGNNDGFLDPGESITCTASYTITQADLDAGSVTNTATASAGGTTSNQDQETVTAVPSPGLSITKTATEQSYDEVGDIINYTIVATNTGNVTLTNVTVSDPGVNALDCTPANGSSLAPGASMTCTATHTITQADLDAGSYANTACVNADGADEACDSEDVPAEQSPALSLVKTASPSTYDSAGDVTTYEYEVTNTGNVSLAGPFTIDDDKADDESCPATASLAPGQSITCTASYTITQADLDAGSVTNVATATNGTVTSNQDEETVTAVQNPELTLDKTASPSSYDSVGDVISYSYEVSNTGNVRIAGPVTVTDDKATVTCPELNNVGNNDAWLDPGESVTCTAEYTITQADLNAGSVTNTARASAGGIDSNEDTETVEAEQNPALSLTKSASPATYPSAGTVISYTYVVTNTGNVSLAGPVTIADDKATVSCPNVNTVGNNDGLLDPGESITCTASYTTTQADMSAGSVTNTARASAEETESNEASATVTAAPPPPPPPPPSPVIDLGITKADSPDPVTVGGELTYTLVVTNNGPDTATGVQMADSLPDGATFVSASSAQGTCSVSANVVTCAIGTMASGASVSITVVVRPTATGTILNTAIVAGNEAESTTANNSATEPTLVVGVFAPPAAPVCSSLTVTPRQLQVGRRTVIVARVRQTGNRPFARARVRVIAPGINVTRQTGVMGIARIPVRPTRTGIARVVVVAQPRCAVRRVGIIGVFRPPLTG